MPDGAATLMIPRLVLVVLANLSEPVVVPATPSVKPPAPWTAKVLLAVAAPFKKTLPVPVLNEPVPVCVRLPVVVMPVAAVIAPAPFMAKAPALMLRLAPFRAPVEVTVPPCTIAVVEILLAVLIIPKPDVIEPAASAPVAVMLP